MGEAVKPLRVVDMEGIRDYIAKLRNKRPSRKAIMDAIGRGMPFEYGKFRKNGYSFDLDKVDGWLRGDTDGQKKSIRNWERKGVGR